jgi:hypothetical protein
MTEFELWMFCEWCACSIVVHHPCAMIDGYAKPVACYTPSYADDNTRVLHLMCVGKNEYFHWVLDANGPVKKTDIDEPQSNNNIKWKRIIRSATGILREEMKRKRTSHRMKRMMLRKFDLVVFLV